MQTNVQGNKLTSPVYVEVQGHQNINRSILLEQITVLLIAQESVADARNLSLHFSHGLTTISFVILATGRRQEPSQTSSTSLSTLAPYPQMERYFKMRFRLRTNKNEARDKFWNSTNSCILPLGRFWVTWLWSGAIFKYTYIFIAPGALKKMDPACAGLVESSFCTYLKTAARP